ncbi:hypothetical protein MKW92_001124 [Papaver armeniacum]|nr:hypothetical protein MKW92_001124 [Papaver armeniacum]
MIVSGLPLSEPYLKESLSVLMREDLKNLKEGKLPMNDSYYLMGTADPTRILKPDQVCVILYVSIVESSKKNILCRYMLIWNFSSFQLLKWFTPSTPWTQTYFAKNVSHLKPTDFKDEDDLEHHLLSDA